MHEEAFAQVIRLVGRSTQPVKVAVVDGHSAAGKSTVAARLADRMPAAVVHGDDFYRVMDHDERAALDTPGV